LPKPVRDTCENSSYFPQLQQGLKQKTGNFVKKNLKHQVEGSRKWISS